MKRKSETKFSVRLGDILSSTTVEQRAWIGAVALAYNDAEDWLHRLAGACLHYVGSFYSVTTRINGTEGLVAIIQESVVALNLSSAGLFNKALSQEGFAQLKTLRDAVIYAKLLDFRTGVGAAPGKRGKRPEEVLLAPKALEGLYKRLILVTQELGELETILNRELAIRLFERVGALDDLWREHHSKDIQDATSRCQKKQNERLSLPPFPKFPEALEEALLPPNAVSSMSLRGGLWLRAERT